MIKDMKIDILNLASLPKKFINGCDKIKIEDRFSVPSDKVTKDTEDMIPGPVSICKVSNGYVVAYGGTRLTTSGEFKIEPIEDSEYRLFVSETLFNAIEDAWNTFHKNYGGSI